MRKKANQNIRFPKFKWPRFWQENDGYALAMTTISLPVLLGVTAFVVDGSRITNLHTDLQNATDAMALAGARELDGRSDAIPRAKAAIAAMNRNQAWFAKGDGDSGLGTKINIIYTNAGGSASDVYISFLGAIPEHDDTPIKAESCTESTANTDDCVVKGRTEAEQSQNAKFLRVSATPQLVKTIFQLPGIGNDTVPVSAESVATYNATACDVAPIFICNPFENVQGNSFANGLSFNENFALGNLYGRQIKFSYGSNGKVGPGNVGFLRTTGNGADALAEALATGDSGVCYSRKGLETKPGNNVGPVTTAINTRFGLYPNGNQFSRTDQSYAPDVNVRKGQSHEAAEDDDHGGCSSGGNRYRRGKKGWSYTYFNYNAGDDDHQEASCTDYEPEENTSYYSALALSAGTTEYDLQGGTISSQSWDIDRYWDITHGNYSSAPRVRNYRAPNMSVTIPKSFPGISATVTPSRYDVYNYEIDNNLLGSIAPNGELGGPECHGGGVTPIRGRRILSTAVVNCSEHADLLKGAATNVPAEAFAKVFLTAPALAQGNDRTIPMEVVDVSGLGGLGTMDNVLREEAELVR